MILNTGLSGLLFFISSCCAQQILYSSSYAYLVLTDSTLIRVQTNRTLNSSNILDSVTTLPSPASPLLAVTESDSLYNFVNSSDGTVAVHEFSQEDSAWVESQKSDVPYYNKSILWTDGDDIYLFGGISADGEVSSSIHSYSSSRQLFSNVTALNTPVPLYASSPVTVRSSNSDASSQLLLIGGASQNAWASMSQIAVWSESSWNYQSAKNSTGIDSRTSCLALPVTGRSTNETTAIYVIGGSVAGRQPSPYAALLNTTTWVWSNLSSYPGENTLGAFTLYDTLITVSAKSTSKRSNTDSYSFKFYDADMNEVSAYEYPTFTSTSTSASSTTSTTSTSTSSPKTLTTSGIAALSVTIPVATIAGVAVLILLIRQRQRRNVAKLNASGPRRALSLMSSSSSMRSWNKKRDALAQWIPPIPTTKELPEDDHSQSNVADVQFLVSHKRRSQLRITNPDSMSINSDSTQHGALKQELAPITSAESELTRKSESDQNSGSHSKSSSVDLLEFYHARSDSIGSQCTLSRRTPSGMV